MLIGWNRMLRHGHHHISQFNQSISIIVPFRNEESNLPVLIETLKGINYPQDKVEVILVDDHSTDHSLEMANKLVRNLDNYKVFVAAAEGKKNALAEGIKGSVGDVIVTTDADCQVPPAWLTAINAEFQNPDVKMVVGGVRIKPSTSFFSKLQALEFSSLIGSAAATLSLGFPTMCNGANLSYRKVTFVDVNGFQGNVHIASGDDEFLMRKIVNKFGPESLRFLSDLNSVVSTIPQVSVSDFFVQRIRWAGKWKHNSSVIVKLLAFFIFLFQFSFLTLILSFFWVGINDTLVLIVLVKILLEGFLLYRISRFLRQKINLLSFLVMQILYPIYCLLIGSLSNGLVVFWKGRVIK